MLITFILRLVLAGMTTGAAGVAHAQATVSGPRSDVDVDTNGDPVRGEAVMSPRVAQVRLAEMLGTADAIHSVGVHGNKITFAITRADKLLEVTATTRGKGSKQGEVIALAISGSQSRDAELGSLSWLADELSQVTAISRLVADADGAVTITTSDGRRYMAIPGRGSGGNTAVSARWAAEWSH